MSRWSCIAGFVICFSYFAAAPAQEKPAATAPADSAAHTAFFEKEIRPLLVEQCYKCHSQEAKNLRGNLYLDSKPGWQKGGDNGPALIPGNPDASLLIKAVRQQDELKMPPKGKLTDKQIAVLTQWVKMGAPDPRTASVATSQRVIDIEKGRSHWSFQPLRVATPPTHDAWCRSPIDGFILAKLQDKALKPNPIADRRTLLRRAYFDLLGLPPTSEEIDAFINDADPMAFEKLIDRLLASPHYGERWARHWLDVARFAESHGYEQDYDRKFAYHYRDFLIKALNDDMPYDQFIRWQIAGDELASSEPQALMATGFLGAGAFPTQLTEMEFESARYDELDDMTATTGVAVLGLSVGCARCHDHKFDPIPSQDYYRLASSFTTTIRSEIDVVMHPGENPIKVQVTSEGLPPTKHHADDRGFPHFYKETHILQRGDVNQKKAIATPGFLQVLMRNGKDEASWCVKPPTGTRTSLRRTALANWLMDPENGAGQLAARVIVNRLWQHHFGRGLVATPNDFGAQGERPTHPELLDWLTNDLIQHGWKLKRLHKLIMTSAVYMQNGEFDEGRAAVDRENQFHWRRTPQRLEAEAIRDSMLHVAGMLDPSLYGPGTLDPNMRRRSIYFFIKRSQLVPMMMLFDWPEHLVSIGQRGTTTIAPQALMFINSPQGRKFAEGFAERLKGTPPDAAVDRAYRLAFGRTPADAEKRLALEFLKQQAATYKAGKKANPEQLAVVDLCQTLLSANEFVYVD